MTRATGQRDSVDGDLVNSDLVSRQPTVGQRAKAATPSAWVTAAGAATVIVGLLAWIGGWLLGWDELLIVAAGCLTVVLGGLLFTIGRSDLLVVLAVEPQRVVAGQEAVGQIAVTNQETHRMFPVRLEAAVGNAIAEVDVPSLSSGATFEEIMVIPTVRRGVIGVGPVRSVRGDPLGLIRREIGWTDRIDLYVHPVTTRLASANVGFVRDLEGHTTNDLSTSDVAFHTLREYVPGDDRRHVHWRTSARVGRLMVRQFVDTRRSQLGLVLSTKTAEYSSPEEFELAVSVVASMGAAALAEQEDVACIVGGRQVPATSRERLLDALAAVELNAKGDDLPQAVQHSLRVVGRSSVVGLVTGSQVAMPVLRAVARHFGSDIRVVAIRCRPGITATVQTAGASALLTVGSLEDLPRVLRSVATR